MRDTTANKHDGDETSNTSHNLIPLRYCCCHLFVATFRWLLKKIQENVLNMLFTQIT